MSVSNQTDRAIGPLQISMSQDDAQGVPRAIVVNGLWSMVSLHPEFVKVTATYSVREICGSYLIRSAVFSHFIDHCLLLKTSL